MLRGRSETLSFLCHCCNAGTFSNEKDYFEHLRQHLKKQETVTCVFKNCHFKTNVYGTFASHRNRKHSPHSLDEFKEVVLKRYENPSQDDQQGRDVVYQGLDQLNMDDEGADEVDETAYEVSALPPLIERSLAHLMLKLESVYNVPNQCIDEVVQELHFISQSATVPLIKDTVQSCLNRHSCEIDEAIV